MTVEEYAKLAESSSAWAHTELINGIIHERPPNGSDHDHIVRSLQAILEATGPNLGIFTRVRVRHGDYTSVVFDLAAYVRFPQTGEEPRAGLVRGIDIVHDDEDMTDKMRAVADQNVPEYWIVEWHRQEVRRHTNPVTNQSFYGVMERVALDDLCSRDATA